VLVSDQAGRSNLLAELSRLGITVDKGDRRLDALLAEVKEREAVGYSYEGADASFELLARRTLGDVPDYFTVESFHVTVERRFNAIGKQISVSEAVVKLLVGGERLLTVEEGNGPVNALDRALRKDLGVYQDIIRDLELIDYKVRILNGGTEAVTRVLIETRDGTGESWLTIGVSENVVDASFEALQDSIIYKLIKSGAKPARA
jgi:2-isopropylmalate synthase